MIGLRSSLNPMAVLHTGDKVQGNLTGRFKQLILQTDSPLQSRPVSFICDYSCHFAQHENDFDSCADLGRGEETSRGGQIRSGKSGIWWVTLEFLPLNLVSWSIKLA